METRNPYDYMECMRTLLYLKSLQGNEPIQGDSDVGEFGVLYYIDKLFDRLEALGLKSTLGLDNVQMLVIS